MNPYEKTAAEMKRQAQGPKEFLKGSAALGTAAFAPMLARAAPLLSQYIPEDLAIKGLSKISPKFGNFIKNAMDNGYDFNEVKDFMGQQIENSQKSKSQSGSNILEQYSPSLFRYIKDLIRTGVTPAEAATKARKFMPKREIDVINKIEKDHKTSFEDVVNFIFPNQTASTNSNQNETNQEVGSGNGLDPQLAQLIEQGNAILKRVRGG